MLSVLTPFFPSLRSSDLECPTLAGLQSPPLHHYPGLRPPEFSDAGRIGPARASHGRCAPLTTTSEPRYRPSELLVVETKNRRFRRRVIHPPAPAYFPAGEFSHDQDPLRTSAAVECGVG